MSFNFPTINDSPSGWNDIHFNDSIMNNALIYDSVNEEGSNSHNLLDNIQFDSSKIFNDVPDMDLPEINDMIDEHMNAVKNPFDNVGPTQNFDEDIEYIPSSFFLTKDVSFNYLADNKAKGKPDTNAFRKEATPNKCDSFDLLNRNLAGDMKETIRKNAQFQEELKQHLVYNPKEFGYYEDQIPGDEKSMSSDNINRTKWVDNTNNEMLKSSPSRNMMLKNNKYSILDKYINVSDDDDELPRHFASQNEYHLPDNRFDEMDSPIRQPQNHSEFYYQGGQSPVANTNIAIQNSPIRKKKSKTGYSHYSNYINEHQNSSILDAPKLNYDENFSRNMDIPQQEAYYQQHIETSRPERFQNSVSTFNNRNHNVESAHSIEQREYSTRNSKPYINNNAAHNAMQYQNSGRIWNNKHNSNQNDTMVSISNNNEHAHKTNNQRLKSHCSVATSNSTILQEDSPYQPENERFNENRYNSYRNISSGSSVKKQSLGLGLKVNTLAEERFRALNNAIHEESIEQNEEGSSKHQDFSAAASCYVRPSNIGDHVGTTGTRKLSKYETPKLQQIPFFANSSNFGPANANDASNAENLEKSPTTIQNKMFQIVKINSPTQEQPLIGVINRSPKGCRKKTTLPPGSIDQHIAELPDKTFMCLFNNCQRKFPRRYNVRAHVQTHLEDKPYGCELCGARFVRKHDMIRHSKTHLEKKYECEFCYRKFLTEKLSIDHIEKKKCCVKFPKPKKTSQKKKKSDEPSFDFDESLKNDEFPLDTKPKPRKQSIISPLEISSKLDIPFGKIMKPISPKKLQQQSKVKLSNMENAIELDNKLVEKASIRNTSQTDSYSLNPMDLGCELK
ncbi:unnamed protein product [Hanseniaspora opuntiae]|uniref:Transcriptional factor SWI5 n=1 Tax=Hanseniaspora opuntiae TaxID=211096 RepID=A0A1E5R4U1_9ASCO|nr:Transcriptional factor SWI5 [Hanseniaspora opuntiae]